ncbi:MAG TPA: hypothetical protein VFI25_03965 [Planctomycetota bacterium]|jgi:hypothetical protein|nr:hypothetical protein [Planctomycetota bacterium]
MRHATQIERWGRMTPEEKLLEWIALMNHNHRAFLSLPKERRDRINRYLLERHEREEGHLARKAPARFWGPKGRPKSRFYCPTSKTTGFEALSTGRNSG